MRIFEVFKHKLTNHSIFESMIMLALWPLAGNELIESILDLYIPTDRNNKYKKHVTNNSFYSGC